MRNQFIKTAVVCALLLIGLAHIAGAQAPAPAPAGDIVVAKPTYVTIPLEITVNRPAAEVWKRVGKYCDIGEWLRIRPARSLRARTANSARCVRWRAKSWSARPSCPTPTRSPCGKAARTTSITARSKHGRHRDDVEARLHADVRQFDAGR